MRKGLPLADVGVLQGGSVKHSRRCCQRNFFDEAEANTEQEFYAACPRHSACALERHSRFFARSIKWRCTLKWFCTCLWIMMNFYS